MREIRDFAAAILAAVLLAACGGAGTDGDAASALEAEAAKAADDAAALSADAGALAAAVAPKITRQPADRSADVGSTATFTVAARGTAPLAYQWRRNGRKIAGARGASHTTAMLAAEDHGARYTVEVRNAAGKVTSKAAVLKVRSWSGVRQDGVAGLNRDVALAVAVDRGSKVAIAGWTSGSFDGTPRASAAYVARYSAAGKLLWGRNWPTTGSLVNHDRAHALAADAAGNLYVVGDTAGALPGVTAAGGNSDVVLAKYSPAGRLLWARQFGSGGIDIGHGVAVDRAGNVIVVGEGGGSLPLQPPTLGIDHFVAKYDPDGKLLWLNQSDIGLSSDMAYAVAVDADGNSYHAGEAFINGSSQKAYVAKVDANGVRQWVTFIDDVNIPVVARGVAVSGDGQRVYVVGRTNYDFDRPGFPPVTSFCCSQGDAFVARFDGAGVRLWAHNLNSQVLSGDRHFDDAAYAVVTDAAGAAVHVAGYTQGVMPGQPSFGDEDGWVARYEADGTRSWVRQFGAGLPATALRHDRAFGIARAPSGAVVVAGQTIGSFGTPGRNTDREDWFVLQLEE